MRVILVGHDASLTGAPKLLLELHRHLVLEENIQTAVFLVEGGPLEKEHKSLSKVFRYLVPAFPLGKRMIAAVVRNLVRFQVKRFKPDYIIYNTIGVGAWAEYFEKIPALKIAWIHELGFVMQQMNRKGLVDKLIRHSNRFIAVSTPVKDNLIDAYHLPSERIDIINGGVKLADNKGVLGDEIIDPVVVGGCGSLIWRKGFDLFIKVADHLRVNMPDQKVQFLWVGGNRNSSQWLEAHYELEKLGLENVRFTGLVENPDSYYQKMDVFLMTSREDPFPLVNLEAANAGLPIICFDKSGGSVEFVDEDVGSVVPYGDSKAMANELITLLRNPQLRREKGDAAHERAQQFSISKMNQRIVQLLRKKLKTE